MPDTSLGITYPASTDHTRIWEHFQALAESADGAITDRSTRVCTSGTRPSSPSEGDLIYETDTDRILAHDGTGWQVVGYAGDGESTWTPTLRAGTTQPTMGNSVTLGRFWRTGSRRIDVLGYIKIGSTFSAGSGGYEITLPMAPNATYNRWPLHVLIYDSSASAYYRAVAHVGDSGTSTQARLLYHVDGNSAWPAMTQAAPVTLATNDLVEITGTYYV